MLISPETPSDSAAIAAVHIAAFANHPYSHQTEHRIVDALRAEGSLTISLVAEDEGVVVGHIAFSALLVEDQPTSWLIVGPLGVLPERQRQGIGSALMRAGL